MDDFRSQLTTVIDQLRAEGLQPVFLVIDLDGIQDIKRDQGAQGADQFRSGVVDAVVSAGRGCDAFTYDEHRVIAILTNYPRLKIFALIEKLRRVLLMHAQSYDCNLNPGFDIIEYDEAQGVAGLVLQLIKKRSQDSAA